MSENDSVPADRHGEVSPPIVDEQSERTFRGLRDLVEQITPWLLEVGSWTFGGLTAVNLIVVSALITVGPVDAAIRTSTAALAGALPLNVAGIVLLRLVKDVKDIALDDLAWRAFDDAGFPNIDAYFPSPGERASERTRRSRVVIAYSLGLAVLSLALTMTGVAAAMWHMARWIAFVLLAAIMLSAVFVSVVIVRALPPESDAERALKLRDKERRTEGANRRRG
jgi:hypothetical protein